MPLILDLPSDLENALTAEAAGSDCPCRSMQFVFLPPFGFPIPSRAPGEELLAYWQNEGLIGTRSYIADAPQRLLAPRAMKPREGSDRSL